MKHLHNFQEYNESNSVNKNYTLHHLNEIRRHGHGDGSGRMTGLALAAGAALAGTALLGHNFTEPVTKAKAEYNETEVAHFPEFFVTTLSGDRDIAVSVNDVDGTIGCHAPHGKGGSSNTITVEEGTDKVYFRFSTLGSYVYATTNPSHLPDANMIDLSKLEVVEETDGYKILQFNSTWSSVDYILVNKGYTNKEHEFEMNGKKYTYFEKSVKRHGLPGPDSFWKSEHAFVIKCK